MNWFNNTICEDYELLADRRVAFLMAWHKRLGKAASISKWVPKDVGKLIARKYLTIKTQSVNRDYNKPIIVNPRDKNRFSIVFNNTKTWQSGCELVSFKYMNPRMQIISDYLHVETPDMYVLFNVVNNVNTIQSEKITLECVSPNDSFVDWMDKFDNSVIDQISNNSYAVFRKTVSKKIVNQSYVKSFKQRQNYSGEYEGVPKLTVKVKDTSSEIVYIKSKGQNQKPMTYKDAVDQKYIGYGSRCKLLLMFVGTWKMSNYNFYPSWSVSQILVKRESDKFSEGKLKILEDNDIIGE